VKVAWAILLISALTDGLIAFGTGLMVGNATTGATYPTGPTLFYSAIGSAILALRTIQQALKALPATADLRGGTPAPPGG